jgi:hypothetical protein
MISRMTAKVSEEKKKEKERRAHGRPAPDGEQVMVTPRKVRARNDE